MAAIIATRIIRNGPEPTERWGLAQAIGNTSAPPRTNGHFVPGPVGGRDGARRENAIIGDFELEEAVRVLLTGATGFIGSAVRARLLADGHEVIAVTRRAGLAISQPGTQWIVLDIGQAATPETWEACLVGIDAAVNCAGVLQDGLGDSTSGVHVTGATALFTALERAGIRRVVHISALGVDRAAVTAFSASKLAGDGALKARNLKWVILRPSIVVAPGAAYGGSALLRGLAALPFLPDVAQAGCLQLVQLQDLVETVAFFLRPKAPVCLTLEVCGPEPLTLTEVLRTFRRWLGLRETSVIPIPIWLLRAMSFSGDFLSLLGWRSPVRTTTLRELAQGSTGDPEPWITITGIKPKSLAQALAEKSGIGSGAMVRQAVLCEGCGFRCSVPLLAPDRPHYVWLRVGRWPAPAPWGRASRCRCAAARGGRCACRHSGRLRHRLPRHVQVRALCEVLYCR